MKLSALLESKTTKSKPKQRSWTAQSAHRPGGGFHENNKKKRNKNRSEVTKKVVNKQLIGEGEISLMSALKEAESIMADNRKGKMIAFFTPVNYDFSSLSGEEVPVEDRHITLGLLRGDESEERKLHPVLKDLAAEMKPVKVSLDSFGVFPPNEHNHGKYVLFAKPNEESLKQIHDYIFAALDKHKIKIDNGSFDFSPHITLKYCDEDPTELLKKYSLNKDVDLENITLASNGSKYHFKLGGN